MNHTPSALTYGNNAAAGHYAVVNRAKLYYEVYGEGEALVLLHGNGGNIQGMTAQIEYFAPKYKVIVMDCRGRGKSELGVEPLTYELMASDVAAVLDELGVASAHVVGR